MSDWKRYPGAPPLPEGLDPKDPEAIERWVDEVIRRGAQVEEEMIREYGKGKTNHFFWGIQGGKRKAWLKIRVEVRGVEVIG